jgi:hypothetical protein
MKKATSLSVLGFDANGTSSGFFRPVSDGMDSTPMSHLLFLFLLHVCVRVFLSLA